MQIMWVLCTPPAESVTSRGKDVTLSIYNRLTLMDGSGLEQLTKGSLPPISLIRNPSGASLESKYITYNNTKNILTIVLKDQETRNPIILRGWKKVRLILNSILALLSMVCKNITMKLAWQSWTTNTATALLGMTLLVTLDPSSFAKILTSWCPWSKVKMVLMWPIQWKKVINKSNLESIRLNEVQPLRRPPQVPPQGQHRPGPRLPPRQQFKRPPPPPRNNRNSFLGSLRTRFPFLF